MKRYALLGEKLAHSWSKEIHQWIFNQNGIRAEYDLLECRKEELSDLITALKKGQYDGFNVTIPYKKGIIPYLDELSPKAKTIGSVNTVYRKDGKAIGDNTDYDGFLAYVQRKNFSFANKRCYILGSGGASGAVFQVVSDLKGIPVIVSRNPIEQQISYEQLATEPIDILINTTPVGMYPNVDLSPIQKELAERIPLVIDIIFNPLQTKLLLDAHSRQNGLWMLVEQAIKAEERWQETPILCDKEKLYQDILHKIKERNQER